MRAENRIDAIERPALIIMREPTEHSSAGWNSRRTSPMDFIGHAQKNARRAEQHGHMAVVATRMHDAFVFRRIRSAP